MFEDGFNCVDGLIKNHHVSASHSVMLRYLSVLSRDMADCCYKETQ